MDISYREIALFARKTANIYSSFSKLHFLQILVDHSGMQKSSGTASRPIQFMQRYDEHDDKIVFRLCTAIDQPSND